MMYGLNFFILPQQSLARYLFLVACQKQQGSINVQHQLSDNICTFTQIDIH